MTLRPANMMSVGEQWYALHTKPHVERVVADAFTARGFPTYLPRLKVARKRRGQWRPVSEPLFPSYLFARLDLDVVGPSALRWTPGLRDIVCGPDGPAPITPDVIDWIVAKLANGELQERLVQKFQRGERVRIHQGPLTSLTAVFEEALPGHARARVLVNMLGRATRVELELEWLEKTTQGRGACAEAR